MKTTDEVQDGRMSTGSSEVVEEASKTGWRKKTWLSLVAETGKLHRRRLRYVYNQVL